MCPSKVDIVLEARLDMLGDLILEREWFDESMPARITELARRHLDAHGRVPDTIFLPLRFYDWVAVVRSSMVIFKFRDGRSDVEAEFRPCPEGIDLAVGCRVRAPPMIYGDESGRFSSVLGVGQMETFAVETGEDDA